MICNRTTNSKVLVVFYIRLINHNIIFKATISFISYVQIRNHQNRISFFFLHRFFFLYHLPYLVIMYGIIFATNEMLHKHDSYINVQIFKILFNHSAFDRLHCHLQMANRDINRPIKFKSSTLEQSFEDDSITYRKHQGEKIFCGRSSTYILLNLS